MDCIAEIRGSIGWIESARGTAKKHVVRTEVLECIDTGIRASSAAVLVETVFANSMLEKEVKDVEFFPLVTAGDCMIAKRKPAQQLDSIGVIIELVGLPGVVTAQIDVRPYPIEIGLNSSLSEADTASRNLAVIEFGVASADLGGENIGPVRKPLGRVGIQCGTALIQMVGKLELVTVTVRPGHIRAVIVIVSNGSPVIVGNVPVKLEQVFLVFDGCTA